MKISTGRPGSSLSLLPVYHCYLTSFWLNLPQFFSVSRVWRSSAFFLPKWQMCTRCFHFLLYQIQFVKSSPHFLDVIFFSSSFLDIFVLLCVVWFFVFIFGGKMWKISSCIKQVFLPSIFCLHRLNFFLQVGNMHVKMHRIMKCWINTMYRNFSFDPRRMKPLNKVVSKYELVNF